MKEKIVYFTLGIFFTIGVFHFTTPIGAEEDYVKQQTKISDEDKFYMNHIQLRMINVNLGNIRKELISIKELINKDKK